MRNEIVWLLLDSRSVGGIESHCEALHQALRTRVDIRIRLLTDYGPHPSLHARGARPIQSGLVSAYLKEKPVAIHTHGYKATLLARLFLRPLGARICTTHHAGEAVQGKLKLYSMMVRATQALSQHNFAVSPQIARTFAGQCQVIDNFVGHAALCPNGAQIAFVGRLDPAKGHDRLAEITEHLDHPIDVYGDGDSSPLQDCERLRLHGALPSMERRWARIGVLLMPSRYEGLPMAALEAISRGIPVISTDVGAMRRVLGHPSCGAIVNEYSPAAFAQLAQSYLTNQSITRADQCAEYCRAHFSAGPTVQKLLKAYLNTDLETDHVAA